MRDLGITVLVALLIVFAGIRFSGYQKALSSLGKESSAAVISTTATDPDVDGDIHLDLPESKVPDKEPVSEIGTAGAASIEVADQAAGDTVLVSSVVVPEGSYWVAVHETVGGTSRTLGARLFGKGTGSGAVELLRPTIAGHTYEVMLHKDNGDSEYKRSDDLEVKDSAGKAIGVSIDVR